MKSKVFIGICLALILAILSYNYIYQDHRNIEEEEAEFVLNTGHISNEFSSDPMSSEQKYLNKTIEIEGTLTDVSTHSLTLDDQIFCQFNSTIEPKLKLNAQLKIKGRFIGYDDLLEQIKLDQSHIIN